MPPSSTVDSHDQPGEAVPAEDEGEDVDMLQGITDADDGGSLASYDPTSTDNNSNSSGIAGASANGRYQRGPPISPMKRSRDLDSDPTQERMTMPSRPSKNVLSLRENLEQAMQEALIQEAQYVDADHNDNGNDAKGEQRRPGDNTSRSSSSVGDGEESSLVSDKKSTKKNPPSRRPQSVANSPKPKSKPNSKSKPTTPTAQHSPPPQVIPSQRPLPPPPPPHLVEQFQTQAKSQAFHMMAVQHLPPHIQAEAAAAAQAAVAIVAARAGVSLPAAAPAAAGGAGTGTGTGSSTSSVCSQPQAQAQLQPPQLQPPHLQMFQQYQQLQMQAQKQQGQQPQGPSKGQLHTPSRAAIDYEAAGKAVATAATAATAAQDSGRTRDSPDGGELPGIVATSANTSPLPSPPTASKAFAKRIKHMPNKPAVTPPTMPNTPATAALNASTLDMDVGSAPHHYFSDRDDQSISSNYSTSSRGSGTVTCTSTNACIALARRRVTSTSSLSTSSGGKAKQQQPKKTTRQVKNKGGTASPKSSARSRQTSSLSSHRGVPTPRMQRARSLTAPGNINGSNEFGIQIPPVPMGPLSPLPSPPVGSPLPDVRSMRVTSPPRSVSTPSSAGRPRAVRQHSYPAPTTAKTGSKAPPATPSHFFHASTTGISPPPAISSTIAPQTPASFSTSAATTSAITPANAWLGQPPSFPQPGGGAVPFCIQPFALQGMPNMTPGQSNHQQATIQCWCGGSFTAGSKNAEIGHTQTKQHQEWIANSQAQFYKMRESTS